MPEDTIAAYKHRLLAFGGATGNLIIGRDWTGSLGSIAAWPASLRTTLEMMLRSPVPMVMLWGEDGVMLYNDAYSVFAADRHPELLGSKVREGWPEVADFNDNVMRVGLAGRTLSYRDHELTLHRRGRPEPVWMNLDYGPVPGDDGLPAGVLAIVVETTERVLSERREAFRLELKARLRELDDASEVMDAAVESLGMHLGADRVGYSEIYEEEDRVVFASCYAKGVKQLTGSQSLEAFGVESNRRQSEGLVEVCSDVFDDPAQNHANWASIDARAFVSVPLIRNERLTASLFVNFREPHAWTPEEVTLIEDVAVRTWEAVERARAEATAKRAQIGEAATTSRFNALLANASIGFAFFDREHRYTSINRVLAEMNGFPIEEHIGRRLEDLLPAHAETVAPLIDQVFLTGRAVGGLEFDGEMPGHPGEMRYWLSSLYPVQTLDGQIALVGATVTDITERKLAEKVTQISEERLRLATEHAEVGFWDVDEINQTLHWPALVRVAFGIHSDRPVTMDDFYRGLHPDDLEATAAAYRAATDPDQRALYDVEYRTVGADDGIVRWIAAKGRGLFDSQGRCTRVLGTTIDITARKAAEQALAASEARLRELNRTLEKRVAEALAERKLLADVVDGTDIFVQVADYQYNWLAINRAAAREFARIFGVREPKAGDNMLAMLADQPAEQAAVRAIWGRGLAGEEFVEVDAFGDPSVERRYYEMRFRTLRDPGGDVIGAYQFVTDVTDRLREQDRLKQAEAALAQSQKMEAVGQLTGGIAHDFNNLLGAVVGSFELIRRKPGEADRVLRFAEAGLQAAERGAKLTGQLLAFSRAQHVEIKPVAASRLIDGMHDLLDRTLGPLVRLRLELQADGAVLSDDTQLEMAILNLAINARDAMPNGGDLVIATRDFTTSEDPELNAGNYIEIAVADTGSGMSPEVAAKAFDPFFTTKGVGRGTGLGLSQVYGIARQAGGSATIDSRIGKGTTVRIFLQRTDEVPQEDSSESTPDAAGEGESAKVLVVDDDPDLRAIVVASLESIGCVVEEAADGPSGLQKLAVSEPDVLLVDFAMPDMNGAEVARSALKSRPGLKVILMTGFAETEAIERARIATPILRKPFRPQELQRAIRNVTA